MTDTPTTREEMLDKIYEVIAEIRTKKTERYLHYKDAPEYYKIYIPIMIWDVLDWIRQEWEKNIKDMEYPLEELWNVANLENKIMWNWKEKRKRIDDQDINCIAFTYSLLPNER